MTRPFASQAGLACANTADDAATTMSNAVSTTIELRIRSLPLLLRDVVDRAGRGADAGPDQRAFPGAIAGARANGGARTGADGRARHRATACDHRREHRDARERSKNPLHGVVPPRRTIAPAAPIVSSVSERRVTFHASPTRSSHDDPKGCAPV